MKDNDYKKLVEKLNKYIHDDGVDTSVSPTLGSDGGKAATSVPFNIVADMDVESINVEQLPLVHALLHQFYACGGTKTLQKKDIEKLHKKVRDKIKHRDFDQLDRK